MSVYIKKECVGVDTSAESSDGKKMSLLLQGTCVRLVLQFQGRILILIVIDVGGKRYPPPHIISESKQHSERGEAVSESPHLGSPNPFLAF